MTITPGKQFLLQFRLLLNLRKFLPYSEIRNDLLTAATHNLE